MSENVQEIVEQLNLSTHPEGGYYREVYRSSENIRLGNGESRSAGTGIYFLLPTGVCTNWHRVSSDELWHFYDGDRLVLEMIDVEGNFSRQFLYDELTGKGNFQQLIPRNCWQRAYSTGDYTLVGCTVAPGFEFDDFEMAEPDELAMKYEDLHNDIINDPFAE